MTGTSIQEKIENKIIDSINSGVIGRLIVYKPQENNLGANLAVERRGKYKETEMYFKIISLLGHPENKTFLKDFSEEDFKSDKKLYLVFAHFDEVLQKIDDFVWLIPSFEFKDVAEVIKLENGSKTFRFSSNVDIKEKNNFSKYIIKTSEIGKAIWDAFENKGKFIFKEINFGERKSLNLDDLKDFVCESRRNTYAANATPIDNPRLLSSVQLEFQKGDYLYRDIHFSGDKKFIGQEIVYYKSKPVWGMNYMGDNIDKLNSVFLKDSLYKLSDKCRLGQRCENKKRELAYQDNGQGDFKNFSGEELIFAVDKNIYKLNYQGGVISENS